MTKPMIRIHDLSTNEIIDREMNAGEFAAYQLEQQLRAEESLQIEEAATRKAALLEKLGISAEEAKLLLS